MMANDQRWCRRNFAQIVDFCTGLVEKQRATQRKDARLPRDGSHVTRSTRQEEMVQNVAIVGIELGLVWATTLHYQNQVEDAVAILNALEQVAPCSSDVIQLKRQWQTMERLRQEGNQRFQDGKYQDAVRFYSEAVQLDPQHEDYCAIIYSNRSAAQMGLGRYHTAMLDCNEALRRKPTFARALLRRARCHVALNMYQEAVKDFDQYLRGEVQAEAAAAVRRERNEANAALARARQEAREREAAKRRAEQQQRQQQSAYRGHSSWSKCPSSNDGRRGTSRRASFVPPTTQCRTYYDVLGITTTATKEQIKKSYRKLALVYHPDKAKTSNHADLFKEMTAAYNVLSDDVARAKYDRTMRLNGVSSSRDHYV
ncbi:hypothetical protein PsorP6_015172 [Peronosclerospora sorghi]|uniref:Uncharacterized protein n=1 Tax=Peronosclerospora sorghi TaxID=230839 RepID=A0ACC0VRL7_9STRA|nr:hypothetical protein PsorP6_015172 [Peronosclerospora sorghi]